MEKKKINLLVNGCSFSSAQECWPYQLSGVTVTNLACAAAGNTYICDSTISELTKRKYDFVAVMWSGFSRVDFKIEDPEFFNKNFLTSQRQALLDWPGKKVNDQECIEKDWLFAGPMLENFTADSSNEEFEKILPFYGKKHLHQSIEQYIYNTLIKMISLQSVLKQLDIPYLFMYYIDYEQDLKKIHDLYKMLDQRHIYNQENIWTLTKKNKWFADDGSHPNRIAHQAWAEKINPLIVK